jgi:acid stress-induced BolA-like protein IbaG/YrbA
MTEQELQQIIQQGLSEATITVQGDGHHFEALIIAEMFADKNKVHRQRLVYQLLNPYLLDGRLHAISLKTLTPKEYNEKNYG